MAGLIDGLPNLLGLTTQVKEIQAAQKSNLSVVATSMIPWALAGLLVLFIFKKR